MKLAMRSRLALLSLLGAAACAPVESAQPPKAPPPKTVPITVTLPGRPETPDAPFRQTPPPEDGPLTFVPPKIESFKLKNGLKVLLVERHDLPIVGVSVVFKHGSGDYPSLAPGVAAFTAGMIEQGSTTRDGVQINDEYEEIGARHGVGVTGDSATAFVSVLTRHLERGVGLMSDVLLHPAFAEPEVGKMRSRRLSGLVTERNSPEAMVQNALAAAVFGRSHPYGNTAGGRAEDIKKITRDDVLKAYATLFSPKHATIVVVGDVNQKAVTPLLQKAFGAWKPAPGATPPKLPPPAAGSQSRLVWVDRPGSAQSLVRVVAEIPVPNDSPDRIPLQVMNAVLGGGLTARLSMNLRETHGYTYGATSGLSLRHGPGTWTAQSGVQSQSTGPAIKEVFHEVARMRDEEIKGAELADAKEQVRRGTQAPYETLAGVVGALSAVTVYDRPLEDITGVAARIDAVTAADVRRVAQKYLRAEVLKVVVVGDKTKLDMAPLQPLNLGALELRDEFGDPIGAK